MMGEGFYLKMEIWHFIIAVLVITKPKEMEVV